ncbi:MAG: SPOR domain-containing protein [Deltaproteobacteria bacterium]|nr:SPOR domain-containing protein [Deltaproteobacteria bacterium]
MRDYKEPISKVQKRNQLSRIFGIMGGMIFAFVIFIVGVRVGIQIERERVRIAEELTSPMPSGKTGEGTDKSNDKKSPLSPEEKDDKMKFTFYETLTKKELTEKETPKEETPAKKEVATKKEEVKTPPPTHTKVEELKKATAEKEFFFVQIASFREKETAEGLRDRLAKEGYTVNVTPVQIEGLGLWYRVRLGGYTTLQEAQEVQKRIAVEENIEGTKVVSSP